MVPRPLAKPCLVVAQIVIPMLMTSTIATVEAHNITPMRQPLKWNQFFLLLQVDLRFVEVKPATSFSFEGPSKGALPDFVEASSAHVVGGIRL